MKLFCKEECNTGRQIEFDIAKAVCILGMVFVHCYEEIALGSLEETTAYYVMVIVLDALFGAATFMSSMGLGIAYSWKGEADAYIKRGIKIYFLGLALNLMRSSIPNLLLLNHGKTFYEGFALELFNVDIMPFAGLALLLFGCLKKVKLSDKMILAIAIGMSILGSFVRFIDLENTVSNELAGLFIGTLDSNYETASSCFPLCNWFIIVVCGYLYGKALRRCSDLKKYYSIALPVSGIIVALFLIIAIPNRFGIMNDDIFYYYHMTTFDVVFCLIGMVFATSVYHYLNLLFSDKVRNVIKHISVNINLTYCIHWVIIGWILVFMDLGLIPYLSSAGVFIFGVILFIVANILAEMVARAKK